MSDTNTLVSVIVPNYCHSRFLPKRLDSILNQTYRNFEIIIIDDCSNDEGRSRAVIESYRDNPKVVSIIYNEQNSGNTFLQWQRGIEESKGEIVWIAESDDYCESNMLQLLVEEYSKYQDSVICYTTYMLVDENDKQIGKPKIRQSQHYSGDHYISHYLLLGNVIRNASTAIFSREAALNVGSEYLNYPGAGDYLFWIRVAEQGSVSIVNRQLSSYRQHKSNVTSGRDADGSNMRAEKLFLDYIEQEYGISSWRKGLAYRFRRSRIRNIRFVDERTRKEIEHLWVQDSCNPLLGNMVYRIFKLMRSIFNYYI